jgi:hypothetical protein
MSFAELKPQIDALDHDEQLRLAAYLKHVLRKDDPAYRAELAHRIDRMDAGHFHTPEEVARLDAQAPADGQ